MRSNWILIAIALVVVVLASYFASVHPDGLEWVAERLNFIGVAADTPVIKAPMPDYSLGFFRNAELSSITSGVIGAFAVGILAYFIGRLFKRSHP